LGTNSAASFPNISAIRCCSWLTDGSSPYWLSPTGAVAIAWRIAGEGEVTVSERRSIGFMAVCLSCRKIFDAPFATAPMALITSRRGSSDPRDGTGDEGAANMPKAFPGVYRGCRGGMDREFTIGKD